MITNVILILCNRSMNNKLILCYSLYMILSILSAWLNFTNENSSNHSHCRTVASGATHSRVLLLNESMVLNQVSKRFSDSFIRTVTASEQIRNQLSE